MKYKYEIEQELFNMLGYYAVAAHSWKQGEMTNISTNVKGSDILQFIKECEQLSEFQLDWFIQPMSEYTKSTNVEIQLWLPIQ